MRKTTIVLTIIFLLLLVASGSGCNRGQLGPEDTVRQFFAALEARDWQKAASYMTTAQPEWLIEQMIKEVDIQNLDLSVISESGNESIVKAEYDIEVKGAVYNDFTIDQHLTTLWKLVWVDNRWLISGMAEDDQ